MYNFSSQKIILLDPLEDRVPFNSSLNEYCFVVSFTSMGRREGERRGYIYIGCLIEERLIEDRPCPSNFSNSILEKDDSRVGVVTANNDLRFVNTSRSSR